MSTAVTQRPPPPGSQVADYGGRRQAVVYAIVIVASLVWLFPVFSAVLTSFRDYAYTSQFGYVSLGGSTLDNYSNASERGNFGQFFLNSAYITIPAVFFSLLLASMVAFVLARFTYKFDLALLGLFTAANLLPPQALLIPVYRMFRAIPMPEYISTSGTLLNGYLGLILVNTTFQTGFCTFV